MILTVSLGTAALALAVVAAVLDRANGSRTETDLDRLQGTWNVAALELDGAVVPASGFQGARVTVEGERFTTLGMGAEYSGRIVLGVDGPHKSLDLLFDEGPEQGNRSLAIYELDGDTWKLCLTFTSSERPQVFATRPGSGTAFEVLKREAGEPGSGPAGGSPEASEAREPAPAGSELAKLQGEWAMVACSRNGEPLPSVFVASGRRVAVGNEMTVRFGRQVMMRATVAVDPSHDPAWIDYTLLEGPDRGQQQLGIYALEGETLRTCFSPVGRERPDTFSTEPGDERTLSVWESMG